MSRDNTQSYQGASLAQSFENFYDKINREVARVKAKYNGETPIQYYEEFCGFCSLKANLLYRFEDTIKKEDMYKNDRPKIIKIVDMLRTSSHTNELTPYAKMAFPYVSQLSIDAQNLLGSYLELFLNDDHMTFGSNGDIRRTALFLQKYFLYTVIRWKSDYKKHIEDIECFNHILENTDITYTDSSKYNQIMTKLVNLEEQTMLSLISLFMHGPSSVDRGMSIMVSPKKKKPAAFAYDDLDDLC